MNAIKKYRVLGVLLGFAVAPLAFGEAQVAMWKAQDVRFIYRGYVTTYSCEILGRKIRHVLHAVGAHEVTTVRTESCNILQPLGAAPTQTASLRINLMSPAAASDELRSELDRNRGRAELLERFGIRPISNEDFRARWVERDIARESGIRFDAGDCELLQQLREQVLTKLAIKILTHDRSCSRSPHRLRKPTLKVLALIAAPRMDALTHLRREGS